MLAYQHQQQQQQGQQQQSISVVTVSAAGGAGSTSTTSTAPTAAAAAKPRLGNHGIGSWNVYGGNSKADSSNHQYSHASPKSFASPNAYRLHAVADSSPLSRSQQDSRGNHRSDSDRSGSNANGQVAFAAPHWRNYHNHYQQQHSQQQQQQITTTNSHRSTRRTANTNQPWRSTINANTGATSGSGNGNGNGNSSTSSNNLNRLTINTAKAMNNRDTTTSFLSSTFQGNESPLLSGISLALSKQKQQYQVDAIVPPVKAIPPLYDVAQPRTPHPLSPADSLKTPGYVDPDSLPFELGSTITDSGTGKQYKLLSVLGEGSYAVVYLALCNHDGAKYALKCLSKLGLTARQLALQRSELEIHSSVCPHPHIVTLYSYFETRDWLFLVMERVSGPDLYDYITQHPAFNANQEERRFVEATRLFEQMIDAVAHIHALKAYHRDLKPENFILGADGNLKLTDFGLATRESLSTDFECGSKPYMSYENRNGGLNPNDPTVYGPRDDYSPRLSDVWALGVLFLNLLFAQSPWTDPSRESCFKFCQFLREGAGFLVGQFPKLPREVADFLVTRVFSPESGRCNVLEFKQWVQALGYPFNPPKPGATAPRPINPRHRPGASGHRRGGGSNVSKPFNPGSVGKKWSPNTGSFHSLAKVHPVPHHAQPTTAVALDSAVGVSKSSVSSTNAASHMEDLAARYAKAKSPRSKMTVAEARFGKSPATANAVLGTQHGGPSALNTQHAGKHNLSTSVPALVFSQIIPATQAAAARKMMPREQNHTAAKAAAAILQSSMLALPKNGLGQGKEDDSNSIAAPRDSDDDAHVSWNQLDDLSEAENEDEEDDETGDESQQSDAGYRAAITSTFPKQAIASSLGANLARGNAFDSEEEMDFSAPLSFEDGGQHIKAAAGASSASNSIPAGNLATTIPQPPPEPAAVGASSTLDSSSYSDEFDVLGRFSDEETFGVPAAGPKGSTASDAHAANRVRFSNIPQPSAILPLARINGNGREDKSVHSTDSSLTATLVTSSVDYYSPKMIPMSGIASANAARKANGSHGSSCSGSSNAQGADDADGGVDADDEADSRQRQHKAAGDSSPVSHRSSNPRSVHFSTHATGHHYQHRYHQKHSKHASLSARNDRLHMMQNSMPAPINQLASRPAFIDAQTSFSWADDAEDLPIPGLVSQPSSAAVSDKCDDRNDEALSDELSWPADDDHNQQSDDMFAMEL